MIFRADITGVSLRKVERPWRVSGSLEGSQSVSSSLESSPLMPTQAHQNTEWNALRHAKTGFATMFEMLSFQSLTVGQEWKDNIPAQLPGQSGIYKVLADTPSTCLPPVLVCLCCEARKSWPRANASFKPVLFCFTSVAAAPNSLKTVYMVAQPCITSQRVWARSLHAKERKSSFKDDSLSG